jgi:hypothetical protein
MILLTKWATLNTKNKLINKIDEINEEIIKCDTLIHCRILVGKPESKRPLGRPRRRWEDNIKMELQEVGCEGMDWIDLAQDRGRAVVTAVMNLRVP